MNRKILQGDALKTMRKFEDDSIDILITSPPYFALRDYKTGRWINSNNPKCTHKSIKRKTREERGGLSDFQAASKGSFGDEKQFSATICPDCNATYEDEQIGSEEDYKVFLKYLRDLMQEAKRIIKPTGTVWVNLGDTYSGGIAHFDFQRHPDKKAIYTDASLKHAQFKGHKKDQIQAKSLIGIPQRFYIQAIDDGWIARNYIPWIKNNAMPSSVRDRFSNKWESIFFFSKSKKYYFDLDPVRDKLKTNQNSRIPKHTNIQHKQISLMNDDDAKEEEEDDNNNPYQKYVNKRRNLGKSGLWDEVKGTKKQLKAKQRKHADKQFNKNNIQSIPVNSSGNFDIETGKCLNNPKGKNPGDIFDFKTENFESGKWRQHYDDYGNCLGCGQSWKKHTVSNRAKGSMSEVMKRTEDIVWCNPRGKNPGDIFQINTIPYKGAHFATFPISLPLKILKAACPTEVCIKCKKARIKIIKRKEVNNSYKRERIEKLTTIPFEKLTSSQICKVLGFDPKTKCYCGKSYSRHVNKNRGNQSSENYPVLYLCPTTEPEEKTTYTKCSCNAKFEPGIVLDPFFGAGSTAVAAEKLGLRWVGIELNPEYIKTAKERLDQFRNQKIEDDYPVLEEE